MSAMVKPTQIISLIRKLAFMMRFSVHARLFILVIFFLLLTAAYNVILPLGRGYDEFAHFQYVRFIAEHHRPPINEAEQGEAGYKARHHPPFYHGLTGLLLSWVDSEDTTFKRVNYGEVPQHALIYEVMDVHWFLPTAIMNYPYQGAILLWHLSRLFSSILSAGAIIITYFIVLEIYPHQKNVALLAAAILAFVPRFVFTASVASDDNMLALLMAIYLLLMIQLIKGKHKGWLLGLMGVVLGLTVITKFSVALVPVMMSMFFCFLAWQQNWSLKNLIQRIAIVVLVALLIAGWWFIFVIWNFNQIDTLGPVAGIFNALVPNVVNNVSGADLLNILQGEATVERDPLVITAWLGNFARTFWAVPFTNQMSGFPLEPFAFWIIWFVGLLVCAGLVRVWRRGSIEQQTTLGFFLLHIMLFLPFMLIRYYLNGIIFETSQGRHILMPAAAAVGVVGAIGWANLTHTRKLKWASSALPLLLLFWSVAHLYFIYNLYPKPLPLSINPTSHPQVDIPVHRELFDSFEFVGHSFEVLPKQLLLKVRLVWQAHRSTAKDYLTEVRLLDRNGQIASSWFSQPANGFYPTRTWGSGEIIYDEAELPLYNLTPGDYTLEAYLLEAYHYPTRRATGPLFSQSIKLENTVAVPSFLKPLPIQVSDQTIRVNYQLWPFNFFNFSRPRFHHRAAIPILWTADSLPPPDHTVKLKLVAPDGQEFEPLGNEGNLKTFMVEGNWPAGLYRLKAEVIQNNTLVGQNISTPWLQIENQERQFSPPVMAHRVEANFYDHIRLLSYDLPDTRLNPGEELSVFVCWQDLEVVNADLRMFNHLYDINNHLWASYDRILPPYYGGAIMWVPGEVINDGFTVPIPADVPDGIYTLRVGLFLGEGQDAWIPLPLMDNGQPTAVTYVTVGPILIGRPPSEALALNPAPQYPRSDNLDGVIKLRGYDLTAGPTPETLELTLYWENLAPTTKNYTTFVHLLDEKGQIVAQKDGPPANGLYPTSLWEVGEVIKDKITLPLPPDFTQGNYRLAAGLYDFATGERLTLPESQQTEILLNPLER